jgi:hypothetical protein
MTATAHCLVAGSLAASIHNPLLGITLSTISHPLLDTVPHWDVGWGWREKSKVRLFIEGFMDLSVGVITAYILFGQNVNPWYFFACLLGSVSWDLAEVPYWFLKWKFPPFGWIYKFQSGIQGKAQTIVGGIATQVATVAIFAVVFHFFRF